MYSSSSATEEPVGWRARCARARRPSRTLGLGVELARLTCRAALRRVEPREAVERRRRSAARIVSGRPRSEQRGASFPARGALRRSSSGHRGVLRRRRQRGLPREHCAGRLQGHRVLRARGELRLGPSARPRSATGKAPCNAEGHTTSSKPAMGVRPRGDRLTGFQQDSAAVGPFTRRDWRDFARRAGLGAGGSAAGTLFAPGTDEGLSPELSCAGRSARPPIFLERFPEVRSPDKGAVADPSGRAPRLEPPAGQRCQPENRHHPAAASAPAGRRAHHEVGAARYLVDAQVVGRWAQASAAASS